MILHRSLSVLLAPLLCLVLTQCTIAPKPGEKPVTTALAAPKAGPLVVASNRLAQGRPKGHSSFLLVEDNKEALDLRLALIDSARSSLDIQLYLWQSGASSQILFDRVIRAADRGVRVRLLVDDFLFNTDERLVSAVSRYHDNIDIRIFNPTIFRGNPIGSSAEFILNFQHLNRRMHNKTWTADGLFTIVGGRNVHDHYFGLDEDYNFLDLDVMAAGPVVAEVSEGFDLFWNSAKAYPGALLSRRAKPEHLEEVRDLLAAGIAENRTGKLRQFPTEPKDWSRDLARLPSLMSTGKGQFLQDHPDPKLDDRAVVSGLRDMTRNKTGELIFVSPYLIPSKGAIERLREGVEAGIEVAILAPTLASNNQPLAHSHYKKKRKPIVRSGARLFELRADPSETVRDLADTDPVRSEIISLHSKAVVGDRSRCFVGSLNLDPRALEINTESGMLIDSEQISNELLATLRAIVQSDDAWEVLVSERGKLEWKSYSGELLTKEPKAPFGKRAISFVGGLLPIEGQL